MDQVVVRIPAGLAVEMMEHARSNAPLEACGIVGGKNGCATTFYATPNEEQSPTRYSIPAADILRITRELELRGEYLYAIFHSHPTTAAYPSPTDVRLAYYPDSFYLIASLANPDFPELRAFTIRNGKIQEHPLELV